VEPPLVDEAARVATRNLKGDDVRCVRPTLPISRWNGQPACRAVPVSILLAESEPGRTAIHVAVRASVDAIDSRSCGRCLPTIGRVTHRLWCLVVDVERHPRKVPGGSFDSDQDRFAHRVS
jgi:hypothetical protein